MHRTGRSLLLWAALLPSGVALADGRSIAIAEALFREATEAFKAGRYAEACPKFAESQKLDPQRGTLANLARCHEAEGKKALAWGDYTQLLDTARQAGDEPRAQYAKQKIAELEPGLPRLQLTAEEGLRVRRIDLDGIELGAAAIGTAFPVDPGRHKVDVTAESGQRWSQTFEAAENSALSLKLEAPPEAAPPPPPPPPPPPAPARPWQRPVGLTVGSIGLAGLGVGLVLGALVLDKKGTVDKHCQGAVCDGVGFQAQKDAWALSTGSTIAVIAGGALLAAGFVLFVTAPRPEVRVQAALRLAPDGAILLEGTF